MIASVRVLIWALALSQLGRGVQGNPIEIDSALTLPTDLTGRSSKPAHDLTIGNKDSVASPSELKTIFLAAAQNFVAKGIAVGAKTLTKYISQEIEHDASGKPKDCLSKSGTVGSDVSGVVNQYVTLATYNHPYNDTQEKEFARQIQWEADEAVKSVSTILPVISELGISALERMFRVAVMASHVDATLEVRAWADHWNRWWLEKYEEVPFDTRSNLQKLLVYAFARSLDILPLTPTLCGLERRFDETFQNRIARLPRTRSTSGSSSE